MKNKKAAIELMSEKTIWLVILILFLFVMLGLYMGWFNFGKGAISSFFDWLK